MKTTTALQFGKAFRLARKARGVSQEALDQVSGRTYVSRLERGLSSPTLEKVAALAEPLRVHPLTLMTLCFCDGLNLDQAEALAMRVLSEVGELQKFSSTEDAT
jgi:transcriptional regulator with XRE-family HTH domain